ncbi:endonuclease domain-containing protein [Oceanobacillus oncorhynchi]|uniref:endonuclease domain-containing protein n=1 Tax=Oceanobacillus oncorhynchi TaxID=545501 RepID=UPI0025A39E20|nr:DUF559 domain-containing protein [Oceanobacillus oncorhynchi]MDM8098691.1 DUF559 domain-containing protein [Oceanobacillus oncorhynchi]
MKFDFKNKELLQEASEEYKRLPNSVKEFLSDRLLRDVNNTLIEISECESPIEQLFGIALLEIIPKTLERITNDAFIIFQEVIDCGQKKYRVDFFIATKYKNKFKGFVIECDGHDFHEKTKEQAKKDKKRDRDLMTKGYSVIRFTGSEILQDPILCAREATNIIINDLLGGE